jgi:hypothetical protein
MIAATVGITTVNAQKGEPKAPDYKITNIKLVPFEETTGKFEDEITEANPRSFFNDLSTSLFVTFEVSGKAGSFEAGRNIVISVTEGKKVKFSKTEQVGLIGSEGKYFVPVFLYSSMCSDVTITAKLTGQPTASSITRKVAFLCGE